MKIILNQDVLNLGEEGDIKEVADGYARNYLFPKKMAVPHNKQNLTALEAKRSAIEKRKEEKRNTAMDLKERLMKEELQFKMPAGENGKLFGSVGSSQILEELEKRGFSGIGRKKIEIPDNSIRAIGNYTIHIKLYGKEDAKIKVKVEKSE